MARAVGDVGADRDAVVSSNSSGIVSCAVERAGSCAFAPGSASTCAKGGRASPLCATGSPSFVRAWRATLHAHCAPKRVPCAPNCGARTFVRLARRIFERFCASAISRAASSSSRSSVFIGASFGARFIVDSSGAFGAGFTAAFGVRTGSGSFFASSDFVVFDAHDGGARAASSAASAAPTP